MKLQLLFKTLPEKHLYQHYSNSCALCGGKLDAVEVHHAVVYKSDLPKARQHTDEASINQLQNLLPVHPEPCHRTLQRNRQLGLFLVVQNHGPEAIRDMVQALCPKTWQARWPGL